MLVQLREVDGGLIHELLIPEDRGRDIGEAGDVTFRGRSYRYGGVAGGRLYFVPSGPTVALREEWLR